MPASHRKSPRAIPSANSSGRKGSAPWKIESSAPGSAGRSRHSARAQAPTYSAPAAGRQSEAARPIRPIPPRTSGSSTASTPNPTARRGRCAPRASASESTCTCARFPMPSSATGSRSSA